MYSEKLQRDSDPPNYRTSQYLNFSLPALNSYVAQARRSTLRELNECKQAIGEVSQGMAIFQVRGLTDRTTVFLCSLS